jgi:heme oxygenase
LAGFTLEVGINRAYKLLEETGSIDSILNKVSDSKKFSNCKRGRQWRADT